MSIVAIAAGDWNENNETNPLAASITKIVRMRFGPSSVTRDVRNIIDPVRLEGILDLALSTTNLADIEFAIQSAVPPPK